MSSQETFLQCLPSGTLLDGIYEIEGVLGSGGFGKTYRVRDRQLVRQLAIKEYFPVESAMRSGLTVRPITEAGKEAFERGLERFNIEARHLAKLQHRNIVKVFRSFDANCTSYIVLEYVEGSDLEDWLAALARPLTQPEIDRLLNRLLSALEAVHAAELVHRDIQPKNIRIRSRNREPVLLDFGIAKSIADLDVRRQSTVIVAHGYAPPESYTSAKNFQGPWTDIYGLAAVFYRALSGVSPLPSPDRLHEDRMAPLASLLASSRYRAGFLEALDWGLALDRTERPQTVKEWRAALLKDYTPARNRAAHTKEPAPAAAKPAVLPTTPPKIGADKRGASKNSLVIGLFLLLAAFAIGGAALVGPVKVQKWISWTAKEPTAEENERTEAARKAGEERLAQAKREEAHRRAAEEAKRTEEARKANEERRAAAEQVRREEADRRAAEERRAAAEQARREREEADRMSAEEAKRAEAARKADEELRAAAEQAEREDADRRAAEEAKRVEEARKAEEERRAAAEQAKREEADRRAAEAAKRRAEQARKDAERRAAEQAKREQQKLAEEARKADADRRAAEQAKREREEADRAAGAARKAEALRSGGVTWQGAGD